MQNTIEKHAPLKIFLRNNGKSQTMVNKSNFNFNSPQTLFIQNAFLQSNADQKLIYKKFLNRLTRVKTLSKKMYFQVQFTENKKDSQKTWKLIKSALPANKSKKSTKN